MKINKFHSPYLLISLSSLSLLGSAPQPQPNTSKSLLHGSGAAVAPTDKPSPSLLAAVAAPINTATLDRRVSAPPHLNLTAASQAGDSTALASPPSFSIDNPAGSALGSGRDSAATAPKRRPSLSAATMTLGPNGTFVATASPALKPLSVISPPHGTGTATQSGSSSHRRNSVSGAPNASPSLRPMAAPQRRNTLEGITNSQTTIARLADALALELATLRKALRDEPLSPRTSAAIKRDIEICEPTSTAAGYLRLDLATKKAALFPVNSATAAAANASTSPNSPPIAVTVVSSPLPGADAAAAKGASTDPVATAKK
jgi:hypothetical protein